MAVSVIVPAGRIDPVTRPLDDVPHLIPSQIRIARDDQSGDAG